MKCNVKRLRKLRLELRETGKTYSSLCDEEQMLIEKTSEITDKLRQLAGRKNLVHEEMKDLTLEIGRTKGLHCLGKKVTRDYDGETCYQCVIKKEDFLLEKDELYEDCCSTCHLSEDKITTRVMMHRIQKGK